MMHAPGPCSRLCLLVGLVAALHAAPAQAQTTLRYKFKEGEKLHCTTEVKSETRMTLGGKDVTTTAAQVMDMTWTVSEVGPDGTAKLVQTLDRVRYVQDGPQGKSEFDSEKSDEPTGPLGKAMAPLYRAMVGADFKVTMSPQGEMSDVQLPQKVVDALKGMPGGKLVQETLKDFTGPGGLRLSADPVKPGDSWGAKVEMKMEPVGKLVMDTKFTYEGKGEGGRKGLERITLRPTLTADVAAGSPEQVKFAKQECKGSAYFDGDKGQVVETSLDLKMELEIASGGQALPVKVTQSHHTKLEPVR